MTRPNPWPRTSWNAGHNRPLHERFWPKVDKRGDEECWLWKGAVCKSTGYGDISTKNPMHIGAHRASWLLHFGAIPDGMFVCHRCDVRGCVNPAHLFLGTSRDNLLDASTKGRLLHQTRPERLARGERNASAKLTADAVTLLRKLHAGGRSINSLAREYGITFSSMRNAIQRHTWRHVP